jgi:hypothetical protein
LPPSQPSSQPSSNAALRYSFDEIVVTRPTYFSEGGNEFTVESTEANYYGEITVGSRSYFSDGINPLWDIDGTYALFVADSKVADLTLTIRRDGYYAMYTDGGRAIDGAVEFPFWNRPGNMYSCDRGLKKNINLSWMSYTQLYWSSFSQKQTLAEYSFKMLAVVITKDEAVRYAQDGTMPNSLKGLTVTGLDEIFRTP